MTENEAIEALEISDEDRAWLDREPAKMFSPEWMEWLSE